MQQTRENNGIDTFVLEKDIFSNVFDKDIKRVYIYKKAERLAKAIHLIGPAFRSSPSLFARVDSIAIGLVDAATLPPTTCREALSRELLALSSVLAIARSSGLLSPMNTDLISREAHALLSEVAGYEEPQLRIEDVPTLASLFKVAASTPATLADPARHAQKSKGHIKDTKGQQHGEDRSGRRDAILSVLRAKGASYIKDISTVVRDIGEKTIQRELSQLVADGLVERSGERRWTRYSLVSGGSL